MQYNIPTGQRIVLAFLKDGIDRANGYLPGGSYGVKISANGSTLYANFNGQPHTNITRHALAFGLTDFAAIHISACER